MSAPVSWKDQSGRQVAEPEFDYDNRHSNYPILLSDAVYVKGNRSKPSSNFSWDEIWKYSIAENCCSPLPTPLSSRPNPQLPLELPGEREMLNFVLSTYNSQLVCIGGYVYTRRSGWNKSELNREVFVWTNNEWNPNIISPLPPDITFGSFPMSVSSNGSQLVLAWLEDDGHNVQLLFYDDNCGQWIKAQGPKSTSSHKIVSVFLDKETIFVTKQALAVPEVYIASVEDTLQYEVSDARSGDVWSKMCFSNERGIRFLSNVTAVGEIKGLVILVVYPEQPITLFVTEKIPSPSPDWKEIRKIELPDCQDHTYLSIVGLSNRELLIMYMCYTGTAIGPMKQLKMLKVTLTG